MVVYCDMAHLYCYLGRMVVAHLGEFGRMVVASWNGLCIHSKACIDAIGSMFVALRDERVDWSYPWHVRQNGRCLFSMGGQNGRCLLLGMGRMVVASRKGIWQNGRCLLDWVFFLRMASWPFDGRMVVAFMQ